MFSFALIFVLLMTVAAEEQHCSKYDFEERILEKLVRMEFQMEKMKLDAIERAESMTNTKDEVRSTLELLNKTVEDLKDTLAVKTHTLEQNIFESIGELTKNVENIAVSSKIPTIAFKARLNSDLMSALSGDYIVFPVQMMNEGNAFALSTGKFTAPVNGIYLFNVIFCVDNEKYLYIDIMVDDKPTQPTVLRSQANRECQSAATLEVLTAGQIVGIKLTSSVSTQVVYHNKYRWSTFSGCLIYNN